MIRLLFIPALATTLFGVGSCPFFQRQTTVQVANTTNFPAIVTVLYDDDQNILEDLLEETGREVVLNIPAGGIQSFARNCDDLQAVRIHADLQIIGGLGPSKTSNVERDGEDFGCGDNIRFTLTADALGTNLDISFGQVP